MNRNRKFGERNRSILLAYLGGESMGELAERYQLTTASVRGIISIERDRVCVSTQPEYRQLRENIDVALWGSKFDCVFEDI